MFFICPVCSQALISSAKSLLCPAGHCYDISKYGYVNLLMSNASSSKRHGDDRVMVKARRDFLNKGYYSPIRDAVMDALLPALASGFRILDAGCGEGWYTAAIADTAEKAGISINLAGVDISREALRYAAKRLSSADFAVASSAHLPVASESCDILLNLFSPLESNEFHRILRPHGTLIRVIPLQRHLWSLKSAVYDKPYENGEPETGIAGFDLAGRNDIKEKITLSCHEDINNLFLMTPYCYKTSPSDTARLDNLHELTTELEVAVLQYKKL